MLRQNLSGGNANFAVGTQLGWFSDIQGWTQSMPIDEVHRDNTVYSRVYDIRGRFYETLLALPGLKTLEPP